MTFHHDSFSYRMNSRNGSRTGRTECPCPCACVRARQEGGAGGPLLGAVRRYVDRGMRHARRTVEQIHAVERHACRFTGRALSDAQNITDEISAFIVYRMGMRNVENPAAAAMRRDRVNSTWRERGSHFIGVPTKNISIY
ncbi:MAG: hypothetical protein ACRYHA_11330 [Janthinobacterium lividum]